MGRRLRARKCSYRRRLMKLIVIYNALGKDIPGCHYKDISKSINYVLIHHVFVYSVCIDIPKDNTQNL